MARAALLIVAVVIAAAGDTYAQPSDAQVKKDVTAAGVKKIILTKKTGTKQWNKDVKAYEYVRGVEVTRDSDHPGIELIVVGDAVYQLHGGKWKYWKFRVAENRYSGLPNPTPDAILAIVRADLATLVSPYWYERIVGDIKQLRLAEPPAFSWASPNRVSFRLVATFDAIISDTEVESATQVYEVTLYRDDPKAPWKPAFVATERERTKLGVKQHTAAEVAAMTTLGRAAAENKAATALAALPKVSVPQFATAQDLVKHTHRMLRESTAAELEAYLVRVLAPGLFVEGSTTQLNQRGADLVKHNIARALGEKATYKLQYCQEPVFDARRSTASRFYIASVIANLSSQIEVAQVGGAMKDGVRAGGQWRITDLQVFVKSDPSAIEFVNSFSDRKKLCPKDP